MSEVKVNKISPRTNCGTVQLGDSGDTITIPAGATITNNGTQTGFGRTGTVDWQTGSIKTATFTAANGEGYFADTSSSAFTMNLPAGSAGNIVSVVDYTNTFQTNALTIAPNGSQKIGGVAASIALSTEGQSITLVYVDDTEGWKNVQDSTSNVTGNPNLVATGGTVTTSGDCKIHTFTGPGTFTVTNVAACAAQNIISHLVIAGGGGGGSSTDDTVASGGGGAGGYREVKNPVTPYTASPLDGYACAPNRVTVTAQAYPITVGGGGAGGTTPQGAAVSGSDSIFSTITSAGGGKGSNQATNANATGGSGGGGVWNRFAGAAGNTPPVSPAQGFAGGAPGNGSIQSGGGGGGASAVGQNNNGNNGGAGGAGVATSINGTPTTRAGGGGGGGGFPGCNTGGAGGSGGGGAGGSVIEQPNHPGTSGTANTGGGGGGGGGESNNSGDRSCSTGGNGGSGIVIIRYKFQ
jgi:hypothetical protein